MGRLILVITIIVIQSGFGLHAQNLILNPSFEEKETCYRTSLGNDLFISKYWNEPDNSTPDFLNPCALNTEGGSVPFSSFGGFQHPRTGVSHVGIIINISHDKKRHYSEFIQGKLMYQLVIGHKYRFKLYYNIGNDPYFTNCITNNIGISLNDTFSSAGNYYSYTSLPTISMISKIPLTYDTVGWQPLEFEFTATRADKYFIVGLLDTSNSICTQVDTLNINKYYNTYLFMDDFSLFDLTDPKPRGSYITNVFTPNNDGLNDTYTIYWETYPPAKFKMRIYNRWGAKLFETQDPLNGWDGKYNDKEVPAGTYVARIEYTTTDGDKVINQPLYLIR